MHHFTRPQEESHRVSFSQKKIHATNIDFITWRTSGDVIQCFTPPSFNFPPSPALRNIYLVDGGIPHPQCVTVAPSHKFIIFNQFTLCSTSQLISQKRYRLTEPAPDTFVSFILHFEEKARKKSGSVFYTFCSMSVLLLRHGRRGIDEYYAYAWVAIMNVHFLIYTS